MTAKIVKGKDVAAEIRAELARDIAALADKGVQPGLAVVLVGEDPASQSYVTAKRKTCAELGIFALDHNLPADTFEDKLLGIIAELNADGRIHGILVQLPLPGHVSEEKVLMAIDPDKDVDGFHPVNVGRLAVGTPFFLPCTPAGIQQMLLRSGVKTEGANAVIVGRSNIVGKPMALILMQKAAGANCTVTVCHSRTADLPAVTRRADILIAAIGVPRFVTAGMVKEGAAVIDVGVNRVEDSSRSRGYRLVGDVDYEPVKEKASMITPVPGGVGPMTITMLMVNTVRSAQLRLAARGA